MERFSLGKIGLALVTLCLCLCPRVARAQAFVVAAPQSGEVQLNGTVKSVDTAHGRFVLLVAHVLADGKGRFLSPAKPKTVTLNTGTTWAVLASSTDYGLLSARGDGTGKFKVGDPLVIMGRPTPTGEIASRLICLIPPVEQVRDEEKPRQASEPAGKNLLSPTDKAENWQMTLLDPAQGAVEAEDGAIKVSVEKPGKEDWRVQLAQTAAFPEPGVSYTLSFRARANPPRTMRVSAQVLGSDFHDIGINRVAAVGSEWAQYEYTFVAQNLGTKGHYLPVFFFGTDKGDTYLADVSVSPSLPEQQGNLLEAISNPAAWRLVPTGKENFASLRINGTTLEIGTSINAKPGETTAYQLLPASPADLVPGRRYVLTFRARSGTPRTLKIRGVADPVTLGPDEKDYTVRLDVNRLTDFGAFPTFSFASQPGTFTLSTLTLRSEKWTEPPAKP